MINPTHLFIHFFHWFIKLLHAAIAFSLHKHSSLRFQGDPVCLCYWSRSHLSQNRRDYFPMIWVTFDSCNLFMLQWEHSNIMLTELLPVLSFDILYKGLFSFCPLLCPHPPSLLGLTLILSVPVDYFFDFTSQHQFLKLHQRFW